MLLGQDSGKGKQLKCAGRWNESRLSLFLQPFVWHGTRAVSDSFEPKTFGTKSWVVTTITSQHHTVETFTRELRQKVNQLLPHEIDLPDMTPQPNSYNNFGAPGTSRALALVGATTPGGSQTVGFRQTTNSPNFSGKNRFGTSIHSFYYVKLTRNFDFQQQSRRWSSKQFLFHSSSAPIIFSHRTSTIDWQQHVGSSQLFSWSECTAKGSRGAGACCYFGDAETGIPRVFQQHSQSLSRWGRVQIPSLV